MHCRFRRASVTFLISSLATLTKMILQQSTKSLSQPEHHKENILLLLAQGVCDNKRWRWELKNPTEAGRSGKRLQSSLVQPDMASCCWGWVHLTGRGLQQDCWQSLYNETFFLAGVTALGRRWRCKSRRCLLSYLADVYSLTYSLPIA